MERGKGSGENEGGGESEVARKTQRLPTLYILLQNQLIGQRSISHLPRLVNELSRIVLPPPTRHRRPSLHLLAPVAHGVPEPHGVAVQRYPVGVRRLAAAVERVACYRDVHGCELRWVFFKEGVRKSEWGGMQSRVGK